MDYTEILKFILENFGWYGAVIVILLLLCIIIIPVGLPIILNKMFEKNSKDITDGVTDGLNKIADNLTENMANQNITLVQTLKESQGKLLDTQTAMIGYIMSNITTISQNNTVSKRETKIHQKGIEHRSKIDIQINQILHDMLLTYMADRTVVLEFHNNNTNIGGLPFLWYDVHYEQIAKDVQMLFTKVQNIPSSNIAGVVNDLRNCTDGFKVYMTKDLEELKKTSTVLYYQLKECNAQYIIYGPLYDSSNTLVGLCVLEYSKCTLTEDLFDKFIKNKQHELRAAIARISALLDFKYKLEQDTTKMD